MGAQGGNKEKLEVTCFFGDKTQHLYIYKRDSRDRYVGYKGSF